MTPAHARVIFARILARIAEGKTTREAFDAELGEGAFNTLADGLYDELRAREAMSTKPARLHS